jgi:hypothetical protein
VVRGADDALAALEGVAEDVLGETGVSAPVDAFELADLCGLEVAYGATRGAHLDGQRIVLAPGARRVREHGLVAHETAHHLLDRAAEENSEMGARYLSGALMLPRREFERDLRRSWNVTEHRAKPVNVSAEMIARRLVQLRDGVATVIDQGRVKARVASPWLLSPSLGRLSRWERELADEALRSGEPVQGDDLVWACPFIDGPWERVVVVAELDQLSLRLSR